MLLDSKARVLVEEFSSIALGSVSGRAGLILVIPYVTGQYSGLIKKLSKAGVVYVPLLMV